MGIWQALFADLKLEKSYKSDFIRKKNRFYAEGSLEMAS